MENRIAKAQALSDKLNSITAKFSEQIDNAENLIVSTDELNDEAVEIIEDAKVNNNTFDIRLLPQILNLEHMMEDVECIRETLKENLVLGKKLLYAISEELELEPNAELLASYSTLSQSITENMRLFLQCYRDISNILMTISKLSKSSESTGNTVNTVNVNNITIDNVKSTAEIIKQLSAN